MAENRLHRFADFHELVRKLFLELVLVAFEIEFSEASLNARA